MKKTLLVLSAIATLFAFVSCGKKGPSETPKSDPKNDETPADSNVVFTWSDYAVQGNIPFETLGITAENKNDYKIVIKGELKDSSKDTWGYGALVDADGDGWPKIVDLKASASGVQEIDIATLYDVNSSKIQFNVWDTSYYTVTSVTIEKK